MNLKLMLLCGFSLLSATSMYAQDEIHKRNGDVIEGRVKEVGKKTITYKRSDDAGSAEFEIDKNDVKKIEYEDGTREKFESDDYRQRMSRMRAYMPPMPPFMEDMPERPRAKADGRYGNNILAIAPLQISEMGIGVGLSYERVLDKKGIVSFYLPIVYTFTGNNNYDYYNDNLNTLYIMPGLKIYPTGSKGIVKYSIGPSLLFAVGEDYADYGYYTPYYGSSYYPYYYNNKVSAFTFGMMVNNTLNINPTPHLHMGLELGLGMSYLNTVDGIVQNHKALAQLGFKVGYRF